VVVSSHPFSRYASIIDDWDAFVASLEQPLSRNLWLNPLKSAPSSELINSWQSVSGFANTFSTTQADPGNHWAYHAGIYHLQELVSMLPVKLLNPQPGERILDLCAAPGSKTVQLALAMNNQGTIVANDKNYFRMKALRHHLERLGIVNVSTTTFDGATYPSGAGLFDKVLADVPCSGEGTTRKHSTQRESSPNIYNVQVLQKRILHRAIALCKPGGYILYSTCTYAPEENEHVVNALLDEHPEISLLPIGLGDLKFSAGITEWQGEKFRPELTMTARLWPHQNNSGGFFLALLRKADDAYVAPNSITFEPPAHIATPQLQEYLAPYDFPENIISSHTAFRASKRGIFIVNAGHQSVSIPKPDGIGLYILKTEIRYPKLTTAGAKWLGALATKQFVELSDEQVYAYLQRAEILLTDAQVEHCQHTGYALVRYQGYGLGMGVLRRPLISGTWRLESLYPKV
jgi:NOL1/NOP2/sun family putative RNA methylase